MNKSTCSKCSTEFEKSAKDKTTLCQTCDNDVKNDILVLQVFKWISFSCALLACLFFFNLALAEETGRGDYIISGKGRTVMSKERFNTLKIAIPIAIASFGLIGFYLGKKEEEKNAVYQDYQNQSDELSVK